MSLSLLQNTSVEQVVPSLQKMITIDSKDPVPRAFQTLVKNNISSAPVQNSETKEYYGFIDLIDIICLIVEIIEKQDKKKEQIQIPAEQDLYALLEQVEKFDLSYAGKIADLSKKNPMCPVRSKAPLMEALKIFANTGAHRVPILQNPWEVSNVLTQSAVIQWLSTHMDQLDIKGKTVRELGLGYKAVVSVDIDDKTIQAFRLMVHNKLTSVAVTGDGELVGNISAKDIKTIQPDALFTKLYKDVSEFISESHALDRNTHVGAMYVHDNATFGDVIHKLAKLKIHRLYLVDNEKHPIGVISLGDALKVLLLDIETRISK